MQQQQQQPPPQAQAPGGNRAGVVDEHDIANATTGGGGGRMYTTGSDSESVMGEEEEERVTTNLGGWWAGGPSADTLFSYFTPVSDLSLAPTLPYFENVSDEKAFRLHRWYSNQRSTLVSILSYLVLVFVATFIEKVQGYATIAQVLVLVLARLLPVVIATAWALRLTPPPSWVISWPIVSVVCLFLATASFPVLDFICVVQDDPDKTRSCETLDDGDVPWINFAFLLPFPFILSLAMHVQWRSVTVASTLAMITNLAFLLPFVDSDRIALPIVFLIVILVLSLVTLWNTERHLRLVFRRETAMRRKLSSLIQYNVGKVVKLESQQRLTELIKNNTDLFMEISLQGVVLFASPGAKVLLGLDGDDLIGMHLSEMVAKEDKESVENVSEKIKAEVARLKSTGIDEALSKIHVRTQFQRLHKNGQNVSVVQEAHPVKLPGREPVIFVSERLCGNEQQQTQQAGPETAVQRARQPEMPVQQTANNSYNPDPYLSRCIISLMLALRGNIETLASCREQSSGESAQATMNIVQEMTEQTWKDLWLSSTSHCGILGTTPSSWELYDLLQRLSAVLQTGNTHSVKFETASSSISVESDFNRVLAGLTLLLRSIQFTVDNQLLQDDNAAGTMLTVMPLDDPIDADRKGHESSLLIFCNKAASSSKWSKEWLDQQLSSDPFDYLSDGVDTRPNIKLNGLSQVARKAGIACARLYLGMCSVRTLVHSSVEYTESAALEVRIPKRFARVPPIPPALAAESFSKANVVSSYPFLKMLETVQPIEQAEPVSDTKQPANKLSGTYVLFVDDEKVNRRLGARMLNRLGCSYNLLEDGDEVMDALKAAEQQSKPYSVIVIDIIMQRTDGAEVCRDLRASGVDIPIIAMTGNTAVRDVQRFLQVGFDMMLAKPFNIMGLARALEEAPKRRQKLKEQSQQQAQDQGISE
eukprot:gb/GECG01011481.1/.p1 GENE.gb/GECG01011481.1/~~gb/GECG01011481.1/.p1  ORF type:complete len:931 (+),score=102.08 gb/GECG01011481.1/:1-2793(+)